MQRLFVGAICGFWCLGMHELRRGYLRLGTRCIELLSLSIGKYFGGWCVYVYHQRLPCGNLSCRFNCLHELHNRVFLRDYGKHFVHAVPWLCRRDIRIVKFTT